MRSNNPDERLKKLETEINEMAGLEYAESLRKEISFRKAIENAIPSGIAVVDDKGKQLYVNQAFCKMVGWDEDELIGKRPPYPYWSSQGMKNIEESFRRTILNQAPAEGFELVFCHRSGKLIDVNVTISSFLQDDGRTFYLANVVDITERKKAEEEVKKSHLLLKSSIESQKDTIIFSVDRDYNYLYFNNAHFAAMKNLYNIDVSAGMNFLKSISIDVDRNLIKTNFDLALKGESGSFIQYFGEDRNECYECFFNPVLNESNEVVACTGLARNITERRQSEQALKESEAKFKEIINQIHEAIIVFDEQGEVIIWNKGAENVSGIKTEDAVSKSIVDIRHQITPVQERDKQQLEKMIQAVLQQKSPDLFNKIIDSEIIPMNSDSLKNVQTILFPIKLEQCHLFCMVVRDTTEIKQYERELLRISEDKDKFYSMIAQYLYNPFNLFHGFTKMIVEELDTLSIREIQKMVVTMSKSATNLYTLLDNLLQWTRMHQGKIMFKPQKVNFLIISMDAISILKPNIESKKLTVSHSADSELTVYADTYMLKTILRNLVTNAIRTTRDEGQIEISAIHRDSTITVTVSDDGIEKSPGYLTKLFDSSEMHATLGLAEEKGSTLGLMLCKDFVEKHGGKIWVDTKKGSGYDFKFTLPSTAGSIDRL